MKLSVVPEKSELFTIRGKSKFPWIRSRPDQRSRIQTIKWAQVYRGAIIITSRICEVRSLPRNPDPKVAPIGHVLPWQVECNSPNLLYVWRRRAFRREEEMVEHQESDGQENERLQRECQALSR